MKQGHAGEAKRAIKAAQRFIDEQDFHPRRGALLDRVVLALVSKALRVSGAIAQLVGAEFDEEAFGLSRTLIEIIFNLRYITRGSREARAKRFAQYGAKWKIEFMNRFLEHTTTSYTRPQLRSTIPDYEFLARAARKFPSISSWTDTRKRRCGTWRRAKVGGRTQAGATPWQFDYLVMYFWTSQYVHATGASMESHAHEGGRAPFRVHSDPSRAGSMGELACLNIVLYLDQVLSTALSILGGEYPKSLAERFARIGRSINDVPPEVLIRKPGKRLVSAEGIEPSTY